MLGCCPGGRPPRPGATAALAACHGARGSAAGCWLPPWARASDAVPWCRCRVAGRHRARDSRRALVLSTGPRSAPRPGVLHRPELQMPPPGAFHRAADARNWPEARLPRSWRLPPRPRFAPYPGALDPSTGPSFAPLLPSAAPELRLPRSCATAAAPWRPPPRPRFAPRPGGAAAPLLALPRPRFGCRAAGSTAPALRAAPWSWCAPLARASAAAPWYLHRARASAAAAALAAPSPPKLGCWCPPWPEVRAASCLPLRVAPVAPYSSTQGPRRIQAHSRGPDGRATGAIGLRPAP